MRKRFEQQLSFGQISIPQVQVNLKSRSAFTKLILALQHLFVTPEYNEKIFRLLEDKILKGKQRTGRPGMDLWITFVLAQTRLCMDLNYDDLHHMANNDKLLRQIMGIEFDYYYATTPIEFEYQNIVDNVSLLDDETVRKLNQVVVEMGHDVFKKKEEEPLRLKTDSFVVESNVHFPTDYNLLWDSARKCIDIVGKFTKKHQELTGWRKINYWHRQLKRQMRVLAQIGRKGGKNKKARLLNAATNYINTAKAFLSKLENEKHNLPLSDVKDIDLQMELEYYHSMLIKHIDLVERRLIKGEKIPHHEKIFSIFEPYTEWINKGKQHPNVELGKNFQITSDHFNLIIDYKIMENEVDKSTVISLRNRVLLKYLVKSWSFDKGFYSKANKEALELDVDNVAMRKKGKLTLSEKEEENQTEFKKLCNKHSAVESNINELEHRGLNRCPDKGYEHFKRYLGLGVCAYNLHKIGAELLRIEREKIIKRAA
ncbi:MAG: ISNCY family transposase [Candidatus Methanofastidiosa archaeon]|nr:ISNCY family transposase [Candidatus Methanofastidiosa archaeon]